MNSELFALCDSAKDTSGKLNLHGVFDSFYASQVPYQTPKFTIAIRLRFTKAETGKHKLAIAIRNRRKKEIIPAIEVNFGVSRKTDDSSGIVNFILPNNRIPLNEFGEYSITLSEDKNIIQTLPIFLKKLAD
jgi:hypothetical protein